MVSDAGILQAASEVTTASLSHGALLYASDEQYLRAVLPFVREGLSAREVVVVVTDQRRTSMIRSALGRAAAAVDFREPASSFDTPARAVSAYDRLLRDRREAGAPTVRMLAEPDFASSTGGESDWVRYEAVLNEVFATSALNVLCPYDHRHLPVWVLAHVGCTHPRLQENGRLEGSWAYREPTQLLRELASAPPPDPGPPVLRREADLASLAPIRQAFQQTVCEAGVSSSRAAELAIGLHEIVANALEHGSARAVLRCWHEDDRVVCEVSDEGPGLDDPLAGYFPPTEDQVDGRGLWLARQIFDSVELHPGRDGSGLCARLAACL